MAFAYQVQHGWMDQKEFILLEDVDAQKWNGHDFARGGLPEYTDVPLPRGSRVKVVSVSRFYDCGITNDLSAKNGYIARVDPGILLLADREETLEEKRLKDDTHLLYILQLQAWRKP